MKNQEIQGFSESTRTKTALKDRLFCKHNFVKVNSTLVDSGRSKLVTLRCEKCGKKKNKMI